MAGVTIAVGLSFFFASVLLEYFTNAPCFRAGVWCSGRRPKNYQPSLAFISILFCNILLTLHCTISRLSWTLNIFGVISLLSAAFDFARRSWKYVFLFQQTQADCLHIKYDELENE